MRRRRSYSSSWSPYVPVARRRRQAEALAEQLAGAGQKLCSVSITGGRKIAKSFWGAAWCSNLERYSDYANRLPRGRTYVRNGSVIDLQVGPGKVTALVSGSEIYEVEIGVTRLSAPRWRALCTDCAGGIDSLVELLQGRFSDGVMEVLSRAKTGMFPEPAQISLDCSCPDWASMCKHIAAVLYGVGARLDVEPELLFTLRQVDPQQLISASAGGIEVAAAGGQDAELAGADLGAMFGIDLVGTEVVGEGLAETTVSKAKALAGAKARAAAGGAKAKARTKNRTKNRTKKAPKQAAQKTGRKARRREVPASPWITAAELRQRGVPNHVVQAWLHKGLVEHSGDRGIYVRGPGTEALIAAYLRRRP